MEPLTRFRRALRNDWLTAGVNAVPVFLNLAMRSGYWPLEQTIGIGYHHFLLRYQNGYGEAHYDQADLVAIWKRLRLQLARRPNRLGTLRSRWRAGIKRYRWLPSPPDQQRLRELDDRAFLTHVRASAQALVDSAGLAHLIEAASSGLETDLRQALQTCCQDEAERQQCLAWLATPGKPSFIRTEGQELRRISHLPDIRQDAALERHRQRYHWLLATYLGPRPLTTRALRQRLNRLKGGPRQNAWQQHYRPVHQFPRKAIQFSRRVQFIAAWQDERKARILQAIAHLGASLRELARRSGVPYQLLGYLSGSEALNLRNFQQVRRLRKTLANRMAGIWWLMDSRSEIGITGTSFRALDRAWARRQQRVNRAAEIHGVVANTGKVSGRAAVCLTIAALRKVRTGDVLVTAMTRPEFLPVLRKISAIVTDEGGITCHAAIVSRELGIPCVIGTKVATKVLKDGDRIEVDANTGVVNKLE